MKQADATHSFLHKRNTSVPNHLHSHNNNNNNNSWISKRYCLEGFIVALTNAASRDSCGENRLGLAIPIPIYILTYITKSPPRNFPSFP